MFYENLGLRLKEHMELGYVLQEENQIIPLDQGG